MKDHYAECRCNVRTYQDNIAIAGATITLTDPQGAVRTGKTDGEGAVSFGDTLGAGTYRVDIVGIPAGFLCKEDSITIQLLDGNTSIVDFYLDRIAE